MSFQPVVPFSGTLGWLFLQRTREQQEQAFAASPVVARPVEHFLDKIGDVRRAEDLVSDRRLLSVALGAFGLDADLNNRFFIRKVLEEGSRDPAAFANKLADKRYLAFAAAFGFGDVPGGNTRRPGFAEDVVARFRDRQFEASVGAANPDLRLVLGFERDMTDLAARRLSNDGLWFSVMGTPPLRAVFERALGLPATVGSLDIDRQLDLFKSRARSRLGSESIRDLAAPELREKVTRAFLVSADLAVTASPSARGAAALAILTSGRPVGA